MGYVGMIWTPELRARFLELCEDSKLSHGDRAKILSREFNIRLSRNACIGWSHRNATPIRKRTAKKKQPRKKPKPPMPRPRPQPRPQPPPAPLPPAAQWPAGYRPALIELRWSDCRWPYGEGPFAFCGRPKADIGGAYCVEHNAMAHPHRRQ